MLQKIVISFVILGGLAWFGWLIAVNQLEYQERCESSMLVGKISNWCTLSTFVLLFFSSILLLIRLRKHFAESNESCELHMNIESKFVAKVLIVFSISYLLRFFNSMFFIPLLLEKDLAFVVGVLDILLLLIFDLIPLSIIVWDHHKNLSKRKGGKPEDPRFFNNQLDSHF